MSDGITRRQALKGAGAAGLGIGALGGVEGLLAAATDAASRSARHGSLADIEHVVILIQENRSFDHYFGTLSGVRGFASAPKRAFTQRGSDGKDLAPFRLPGDCIADIGHQWGIQHRSWNGGRMDHFLTAHQHDDGVAAAPETMGYYTRADLPFYYALADAFTICDGYHCSALSGTDTNRLLSMTATIDPGGSHGGPLLSTKLAGRIGGFSWRTMPEQLQAKGISWKQYVAGGGGNLDNVLTYFNQYRAGSAIYNRGIASTYADFLSDVAQRRLPQVSWLALSLEETEHPGPPSSSRAGEAGARQVIEALIAQPEIWRKTALFITWDENGGFFDHVKPPTPPRGTPGEYLTIPTLPADAEGIRGPIGLGFRVPMLVVSPFSRGGLVCSDTLDHTSTLRFLETRFRVRVPNLSTWRRKNTGDLTGAFDFAATPNTRAPRLPNVTDTPCAAWPAAKVSHAGVPRQERGRRRRPSGIVR